MAANIGSSILVLSSRSFSITSSQSVKAFPSATESPIFIWQPVRSSTLFSIFAIKGIAKDDYYLQAWQNLILGSFLAFQKINGSATCFTTPQNSCCFLIPSTNLLIVSFTFVALSVLALSTFTWSKPLLLFRFYASSAPQSLPSIYFNMGSYLCEIRVRSSGQRCRSSFVST